MQVLKNFCKINVIFVPFMSWPSYEHSMSTDQIIIFFKLVRTSRELFKCAPAQGSKSAKYFCGRQLNLRLVVLSKLQYRSKIPQPLVETS